MRSPQDGPKGTAFKTTPWSLLYVLRRRRYPKRSREAAMAELCAIYWRPIYGYIQRCGFSECDAQDLTQRFMIYLIDRETFAKANQRLGKFRTYVLGTLNHFLMHARRDEQAQKRGGGLQFVSLDDDPLREFTALQVQRGGPPEPGPADREWALALRQRVDDRIAGEYAAAGKTELYLALRRHLTGEKSPGRYKDDARQLGRSVATIRSDVARMRQRYGDILLEELRKDAPRADPREELFNYLRIVSFL